MTTGEVIAVISAVVAALTLLVSCIWTVAKIKAHAETAIATIRGSTDQLATSMNGLTREMTRLYEQIEQQGKQIMHLESRQSKVEGQLSIFIEQRKAEYGPRGG